MRIGLIDVDGHNFPNLALMKLSAYHKSQGDTVEWYYPLGDYDNVFASKVFTFTGWPQVNHTVTRGGSGYDLAVKLDEDIEHVFPDYSLYGINDTAYGYLTRGCPRHCGFCIVENKLSGISRNNNHKIIVTAKITF
ncbi:hypothetical protein FACS1894200_10480 [Spirochaetia bacterium]|nr:hypothetical protein FACS1894200_10480 [Spirochaetia bacterium]